MNKANISQNSYCTFMGWFFRHHKRKFDYKFTSFRHNLQQPKIPHVIPMINIQDVATHLNILTNLNNQGK